MKKKAIIISIPFIVIAAVIVYFFVRYSSVERSIYLKNLNYRFDWKLSGARESTYDEQKSFGNDYYIVFKESGRTEIDLDEISEICEKSLSSVSDNGIKGVKTKFIFDATGGGEYLYLYYDENGMPYKVGVSFTTEESRYNVPESELKAKFPGCEVKIE
ncbi:MAG: hypothetical protein IJ871_07425 [Ruminococcus sp.]|nr:hypothetical protein [Ruminococcus sp.]